MPTHTPWVSPLGAFHAWVYEALTKPQQTGEWSGGPKPPTHLGVQVITVPRCTLLPRALAQPTLNVGQLERTTIPTPNIPDQRRIVAYLDALSAKAGLLETMQQQSAAELDALLPSILDRAFRGEL